MQETETHSHVRSKKAHAYTCTYMYAHQTDKQVRCNKAYKYTHACTYMYIHYTDTQVHLTKHKEFTVSCCERRTLSEGKWLCCLCMFGRRAHIGRSYNEHTGATQLATLPACAMQPSPPYQNQHNMVMIDIHI
eukprot:scpid108452/ scgid21557/ 